MSRVLALRVNHERLLTLLDLEHPVAVTRTFTTLADAQARAVFQFFARGSVQEQWRSVGRIVSLCAQASNKEDNP